MLECKIYQDLPPETGFRDNFKCRAYRIKTTAYSFPKTSVSLKTNLSL